MPEATFPGRHDPPAVRPTTTTAEAHPAGDLKARSLRTLCLSLPRFVKLEA